MLFENTKQRLPGYHGYPPGTEEILVFDRYDDISSKDHERIRRGDVDSTDYNLPINSSLPSRDAILKNKHNKLELSDMSASLTWMQTCQLTVAIMVASSMTRQV